MPEQMRIMNVVVNKKQSIRPLCVSLLIAVAFLLNNCGVMNFGNLALGGLDVAGAGGNAASSPDSLSDTESELFSDGPIALPVTIAKLDPPDATSTTVEITSSTGAFLVKSTESDVVEGTINVAITGKAATTTPKIVGYTVTDGSVDMASEQIVATDADAHFTLSMTLSSFDQEIIFAGLDAEEQNASPFLRVAVDETTLRYFVITTNSSNLNGDQRVTGDDSGLFYVSTRNDTTGNYTLVQRNIDGSRIGEVFTDEPAGIQAITAIDGAFSLVNTDGKLKYYSFSEPVADESLALTNSTPQTLENYIYAEQDIADLKAEVSTDLMMTVDGDMVVAQTAGSVTLDFYRPTGAHIPLIWDSAYLQLRAAYAKNQNSVYVIYSDAMKFHMARVDLNDSVALSWINRTEIEDFPNDDLQRVYYHDVSDDGRVIIYGEDIDGNVKAYIWSEDDGFSELTSLADEQYVSPRISPDGKIIVACKLAESPADNQFVYILPDNLPEDDQMIPLTDKVGKYGFCGERSNVFFDQNNLMHFYVFEQSTETIQHAVMNLNDLVSE